MFNLNLTIISAFIYWLFEYFVLLKVYTRSKKIQVNSLIVGPSQLILALYISHFFQTYTNLFIKTRVNPIALFIAFTLVELPFSIKGYEVTPNASILERVILGSAFAVVATIVGQSILKY